MTQDNRSPLQIAQDSIIRNMDRIYNSIAATLDEISDNPKYQTMTGPEALRHAAGLIRCAPKNGEK